MVLCYGKRYGFSSGAIMALSTTTGQAFAAFEAAIKDAYDQGFKAGVAAVIAAAQTVSLSPNAESEEGQVDLRSSDEMASEAEEDTAPVFGVRAPKGLLDEVLDKVLRESPGLSQDEVEQRVLTADSRIAAKSVYNKLRHYEKTGRKYRRKDGLWYRIADLPSIFTSPAVSTTSYTGFFNNQGGKALV